MKRYFLILFFLLLFPVVSAQNTCGNHKLESQEDCMNCYLDAGCKIGYFCGSSGICTQKAIPPYLLILIIPIALAVIISLYLISTYTEKGFEFKEVLSILSLIFFLAMILIFFSFNLTTISTTLSPVTKNAKVLIDGEVARNINTMLANASHEFVLCLKGAYAESVFEITDFSSPPVKESTNFSVKYGACNGLDILGTIHSHPDGKCSLSGTDKFTFGKKGHVLTAIACGKNEWGIYSQENLDQELYYVVRDLKSQKRYGNIFAYSLLAIIGIFMAYYMIYLQEGKKDFYTNLSKIYWKLSKDEKAILKYLIEEKKLSFEELRILTEFSKEKLEETLKRLSKMYLIIIEKKFITLNVKKRW